VRVLVADGRARVVVSSRAPFRAIAGGRTRRLPAGRYAVPGALRPPIRFVPGAQPLALDGRGYRGDLLVRGAAGSLSAVNDVPLERYLRGVVTSEMPFSWRAAALEAQAVASRSYVLSQLKPQQPFDVFGDARDQVYGGIPGETRAADVAVGATAGQILTWDGRVALTYFDSTSGGRTQAVADAIPGMPQLPYLVAVDDIYDVISPHHRWGPFRFTSRELASRLGVPAARNLTVTLNASGRVAAVEVAWRGGKRLIAGRDFQAALALPSTWFDVRGARVRRGPGVPAAAAAAAAGDWPAGRAGWTVVLQSLPESSGLAAARAVATRAGHAGAPGPGVAVSSQFSSLRPGYLIVFSGVYASAAAAEAAQRSLAGRFPRAYVRRIAP